MLDTSYRTAYNEDHEAFRDTVRKVFAEHMTPFLDQHEEEGIVPRSAWKALGGPPAALPCLYRTADICIASPTRKVLPRKTLP